jgi:hypothetical protein
MPIWSRRRALQAAATTATLALAGCNASTEYSGSSPRGREGDPVTDYDAELVRDPDGRVLFWREDENADESAREHESLDLLTDPLSETDVRMASNVPAADALRSFVADTDFERQSVFLFATRVSGCRELALESVRRSEGEVDVSVCQALRPADVACEQDIDHTAGIAVRLPFPAEDVNSLGIGSSSQCRERVDPVTLSGGEDS